MARRTLPKPYQDQVDRTYIVNLTNEIENLTSTTLFKGERIELNGADSSELILVSPNGTRYKLTVNDAGTLSTVAV